MAPPASLSLFSYPHPFTLSLLPHAPLRLPTRYLPEITPDDDNLSADVIEVNLNQPMADILSTLTQYPIRTRLSLTGTLVVARDIAHAKLKERLDAGDGLPQYVGRGVYISYSVCSCGVKYVKYTEK